VLIGPETHIKVAGAEKSTRCRVFQVRGDGFLTGGQAVGTADGANNCPHSWRAAD
jgi:uncharacterized repeat protein (TIGR04076 family)